MNDLDPTSAFHPDNIQSASLIALSRIYDVLVVMAINQAGDDNSKFTRIMALLEQHEQGIINMSPPAFREV